MSNLFPFILGVVFVGINGITQLVFAQTQGFKLKPASIGLLLAAALTFPFQLVTPITGQSAMIALAGKTKKRDERVAALLLSSVMMTLLGITGAVSLALDFIGPAIIAGMMAGVGLMLTQVGVDFIADKEKGNLGVGVVSLVVALIIYVISTYLESPHALVYTVAGSVLASTAYYLVFQHVQADATRFVPEGETENGKFWTKSYWQTEDWKIVKPNFTFGAILAALALICLGIGITVSFGTINANIAGTQQNMDHLTLASGVAGFVSELFGGVPLETIISGTAAAPWPVAGSFSVMVLLAILLLLGVITKIAKYIPTQSIAGFLIVIGIFSTFLLQLRNPAFGENMMVAGVTMAITKLTNNPFLGVVAGLVTRQFGRIVGLPI